MPPGAGLPGRAPAGENGHQLRQARPQARRLHVDEDAALDIGGYLVVDNLAMGSPSMGGIRMLPDITPADIHNLARGMTLKNAAANLPFGGGKAGIVAAAGLSPEAHTEVIRRFARLIRRYRDIYVRGRTSVPTTPTCRPSPIGNGLDGAVSKPAEMGGNRIDELGAAAGGVVIALGGCSRSCPV